MFNFQAASVFVLYATSQANTVATNQSRKTISGSDVISAMSEMEFDKFVRPLENSLASEFKFDIDKAGPNSIYQPIKPKPFKYMTLVRPMVAHSTLVNPQSPEWVI